MEIINPGITPRNGDDNGGGLGCPSLCGGDLTVCGCDGSNDNGCIIDICWKDSI